MGEQPPKQPPVTPDKRKKKCDAGSESRNKQTTTVAQTSGSRSGGLYDKHTIKQNQTPTENQIHMPPQNH